MCHFGPPILKKIRSPVKEGTVVIKTIVLPAKLKLKQSMHCNDPNIYSVHQNAMSKTNFSAQNYLNAHVQYVCNIQSIESTQCRGPNVSCRNPVSVENSPTGLDKQNF